MNVIKKWKLFLICLSFLIIGTGLLTIRSVQIWNLNLSDYFSLWGLSCVGVFSLGFNASAFVWGVPNLIALFLHPIKPNKFTGSITILAFILWLIMGLGGAYVGV